MMVKLEATDEMVEFISEPVAECEMCVYQDIDCILLECDDGIKKWLELEATDEQ